MKTVKNTFPVLEMSCAACAASVEKELKHQPGVQVASVSYASGCAVIEYDEKITNPDKLRHVVRSLGYDMDTGEYNRKRHREDELKKFRNLQIRAFGSLILSAPVMVIAMGWMHAPWANYLLWGLTTTIMWLGRKFFINAWKMTTRLKSGMDTLVALSTGTAYVLSTLITFFPDTFTEFLGAHTYYEPAAMVISFVLLGKYLEDRSRLRAADFLDTLTSSLPESALRRKSDLSWEEVPVHLIRPGDILMVRLGDRIAVDGIVTEGQAWIDERILTGESLPVAKKPGDTLYAGCVNTDGLLYYRATQTGIDSRFSKIIALVEEARSSKPSVQQLADRISAIFVPVVLIISAITFLSWWLIGGSEYLSVALITSLAVLVVACPCALGLATPTAVVNAIGTAARWDVLVKNAETFETASRISHLFLDKTGTLTSGTPSIDKILNHSDLPDKLIRSLILSMESKSNHPLAKAISKYLNDDHTEVVDLEEWSYHPGKGIKASYINRHYYLGSLDWMNEVTGNTSNAYNQLSEQARFYLFSDTGLLASIEFTDTLRPGAQEAINELKELNIEVSILSGDADSAVRSIAEQLDVHLYHSRCSPEEKLEHVRRKKSEGHLVAMAGDGVNDGAALALSDVGIAMGSGAHLAIESAQIIIKSDSPLLISRILKFSRYVKSIIYQNLFWAFIYNIIAIPVAAGLLYPAFDILLQPHWAGAAMALSSVSVVLSSLRLRYYKLKASAL